MFDKDLLHNLNIRKITLDDAREIQSRRQKRRERYDAHAEKEGFALKGTKESFGEYEFFTGMQSVNQAKRYKKPALKTANVLKTSKKDEINPDLYLDLSVFDSILEKNDEKSL